MKREEFYYDSRDGKNKIHAVKWIPDGEVKFILQIIHGMAEHIMRYENVASWMCQNGVLVVGDDHLGHGLSVSNSSEYGYFCKQDPATVVVRDVHRLKKLTQEQYPGIPYFILGHSMGSLILRNYLFKYGTGIQGAIICGTASNPKPVVKIGLFLVKIMTIIFGAKHRSNFVNTIVFGDTSKNGPEHKSDWLCTDRNVVLEYDKDAMCGFTFTLNGFRTLFTIVDRLNNQKNLSLIPKELPIMIISGSEDIIGNCGEGVRKVHDEFKKLNMRDVECTIYDGLRHEILNEPMREEIYQQVYNWIVSKIR